MSSDLLNRLVLDSDNSSNKYKQSIKEQTRSGLARIQKFEKSKKVKKFERIKSMQKVNKKTSKALGDKFKSTFKKMKISTNKNLILEKNINYLNTLKEKSKISDVIANHLLERLSKK